MPGRHYLTTDQAKQLDELLRWFDRIGRKLRLFLPSADRRPQVAHGIHQGKLTANLLYDDTTGVTVNIWTGPPWAITSPLRTIENVLPPLVLSSGQLDSGDAVTITRINGKWYATNAPC